MRKSHGDFLTLFPASKSEPVETHSLKLAQIHTNTDRRLAFRSESVFIASSLPRRNVITVSNGRSEWR